MTVEFSVQIWNERAKEITALHNGIGAAYRRSVADAVRIGELLSILKAEMEYGQYLAFVGGLPFSKATAKRYVQLFEYKDKTLTMSDLQSAYKAVKQLESQNRQQERERKRKLVATYLEAGEKPEGWDRSVDYVLQNRQEDATALSEANQDVEINEGEPIEKEVLADYKDLIDHEFKQAQRAKTHQTDKRELCTQIDRYLKAYPEDIDYLQAYLLDKKMTLPHPRSDADIDRILANFEY
jgi:hypothetical protein